jgi:hypothetical protein
MTTSFSDKPGGECVVQRMKVVLYTYTQTSIVPTNYSRPINNHLRSTIQDGVSSLHILLLLYS